MVVRKHVRILGDNHLGIVVEKKDNTCIVMWSTPKQILFQEHEEDALLEVNDDNSESIKRRRCISK